jgi:hypothetical protein
MHHGSQNIISGSSLSADALERKATSQRLKRLSIAGEG